MKNIFNAVKNSISRRMGLIKGVFIFSVLLFVIHEVGRIAKDVSVSSVRDYHRKVRGRCY